MSDVKLIGLPVGAHVECQPLMSSLGPEPVILQPVSTTDEDTMLTATYYGITIGTLYVVLENGAEVQEWM